MLFENSIYNWRSKLNFELYFEKNYKIAQFLFEFILINFRNSKLYIIYV